jgi:hypothetical protein
MLVALIAALGSAAPAAAAGTPAPAIVIAVDPAALQEAFALLDVQQFESQALHASDLGLEAMMAVMTERLNKVTEGEVPDEFLVRLRQTMRDHVATTMRAKMPRMKREAAEIYAREFTRQELARLRVLSADSVMIKLRDKSKTMNPQLMMIGMRTMREAEPELTKKVEQLVADYLKSIGKDNSTS